MEKIEKLKEKLKHRESLPTLEEKKIHIDSNIL